MPDIEWPSIFPELRQDYGFEPADGTLRSQMDSGWVRQRQRFTVDSKSLDVGWDFDDTTFRYFESWFRAYLALGSAWFTLPIALGGGLTTQRVRFVGGYKERYVSHGYHEVRARLEVFDSVGLDPNLLSLLLDPDFSAEFEDLETAIYTGYSNLINNTFRTSLTL